jgi:hypothetical protein
MGNKNLGGGGKGGGGGEKPRHPFIEGLLRTLPDPDTEKQWPLEKRIKWLQTAANIFDLIYEGEGGIKVEPATARSVLRVHRTEERLYRPPDPGHETTGGF